MVALGFAQSADKAIERIGQECDKLSGTQRAMSIGGEDFIGSIRAVRFSGGVIGLASQYP